MSDIEAYTEATFAIVNNENEPVDETSLKYYLFKEGSSIGKPHFCEHDFLFDNKQSLLPGDKLTIRCEIILDKIEEYYEKIEHGRVEDFKDDFGMLFDNEKLSDVTILIENGKNKFYAHKYVLAKKSEVFAAMFAHDMLENKNNTVNIEDVPFKAMRSMLRYIYVGKAYISDSSNLDLIKAADKYQVLDLKTMCENDILTQLTIENSIDLLTVADQSNALTLKTEIIDFIVKNAQILIGKPEFESMKNLHPEIWCELFRKMALRNC